MELTIREAIASDVDTIAEFNSLMAAETESSELSMPITTAGVRGVLENSSRGHYWVAEIDGRPVGQLLITFEWSDWRNGTIWWIQSVYVHPDFRRKGVLSALYRHVESLASTEPRVCGIRLYVDRDNATAQRTYDALGMSMTDYLVMERLFKGEDRC